MTKKQENKKLLKIVPIVPKKAGNISNPSSPKENKKQVSCKKYWHFVLNNWTEEEYKNIISVDRSIVPCLVVNKEVGSKTGTPHLQGFLEFDEKRRPMGYFTSVPRMIWSGMYAKAKPLDGKKYCSKMRTRVEGTEPYCRGWEPPYIYDMDLRPWQQKIVDINNTVPNERTIYWFWESTGGIGKTCLQRWLYCHAERVIMLSGRRADMAFGIAAYKKAHDGTHPRTVLINIPRSDGNRISYSGMEECKEMFFYSTKYECDMIHARPCHMFVFANFPPDLEGVSADRWIVQELEN
ncbi:MAG: putative replication-associated protein [Circoviridae sp.]|nr:MAG: putative replication-associated protein [Circoviridae sp.]